MSQSKSIRDAIHITCRRHGSKIQHGRICRQLYMYITGGNPDDTLQELLEKMKDDAQLWHDLLWCSGGKFELSKCGYHVIYYDFDDSGIPQMRHSPGDSITLTNDQGDLIPIHSKNIYQTRINIGHAKGPGDTGKTEFGRTLKKASIIGDAIQLLSVVEQKPKTKCCIDLYGNLPLNTHCHNLSYQNNS
jgi:hypothetical protein